MKTTFLPKKNIFMGVALLMAIAPCLLWYFSNQGTQKILIAAGQKSSQSYAIVSALAQVAHQDYPDILVEVIETRGAEQNAQLLERGLVQLATTQAERLIGTKARLVADLYPDTYQLIVAVDSQIERFEDLKGRKIALQSKGSGEFEAFWTIAEYFDLNEQDITVYTGSDKTVDWVFANQQVDAVFRVRSPGDKSITTLVKNTPARFISIDQAAALKLKYPSRMPATIPKGAYNGSPPRPSKDINAIAENQLLIARSDVDADVIEQFTAILFDKRQELTNLEPLAGLIKQPLEHGDHLIPIHEGVRHFWDREKPSFIQENAEPIAMIVSVCAILGSILMKYFSNNRRRIMHGYNRRLMNLSLTVKQINDNDTLQRYNKEFEALMIELLDATESGMISAEDYTTLSFTFELVNNTFNERRNALAGA